MRPPRRAQKPARIDARSFLSSGLRYGRADRLVDGAPHAGLGREGDLAEVGVVDVAGEDARSTPAARPLAGADLASSRASASNESRNAGPVVEVERPAQLLAEPLATAAPGAVADRLVPGLEVVEAGRRAGRAAWWRSAGGRSRPRAWSTIQSHSSSSTIARRSSVEHPPGAGVDRRSAASPPKSR